MCDLGNRGKVMLVHGYLNEEMRKRVTEVLGEGWLSGLAQCDGCYDITVCMANPWEDFDNQQAMEVLCSITEQSFKADFDTGAEEGTYEEPHTVVVDDEGTEVLYYGSILGYEEDGVTPYSD